MAYRGGNSCDAHCLTAAVGCCHDCASRICEDCEVFVGMECRCVECARHFVARRRLLARAMAAIALCVALIAGLSGMSAIRSSGLRAERPPAASWHR